MQYTHTGNIADYLYSQNITHSFDCGVMVEMVVVLMRDSLDPKPSSCTESLMQ